MREILLIAAFGAVGAVARYGCGVAMHAWLGSRFAWGTLAVNVLGCLLIGVLMGQSDSSVLISRELRLALVVGFLGAFTTFSAFGYETLRFLNAGQPNLALFNVAGNVVLGCGAVWLGMQLNRVL